MDGTVRTVPGGHELRFERHFRHPVERVWAALTRPEELVAWLAQTDVDLTQGGRVEFRWLNTPTVARGRVTAYEPLRLVEYDTDIHGRLRWELEPEGTGCRLVFTCTLAASPEDRLSSLAGWHIHLDHLADALEGRAVDWPHWWEEHGGRWKQYHEHYASLEAAPK